MKKLFTSIGSIIREILSDERGRLSSKRIVGVMCAIFLCLALNTNKGVYVEAIEQYKEPSSVLIETLGVITLGCLGLTSIDKYTHKKNDDVNDTTPNQTT